MVEDMSRVVYTQTQKEFEKAVQDWMSSVPIVETTKKPDLTSGVKFDSNKPRLDLIPPEVLFALGDILKFGADKYEDRNWEKGLEYGRVFAALQRHLWAWFHGEERDQESGRSHLDHALTNIAFLVAFERRGTGTDNRPHKT